MVIQEDEQEGDGKESDAIRNNTDDLSFRRVQSTRHYGISLIVRPSLPSSD
jgi:hypothetical protein